MTCIDGTVSEITAELKVTLDSDSKVEEEEEEAEAPSEAAVIEAEEDDGSYKSLCSFTVTIMSQIQVY